MAAGVRARDRSFAHWPARMRWNFVVLGADIAFFSLGLSISSAYTVLPLFVHHLTANNIAVALIPAVRSLGLYAPGLVVVSLVERQTHTLPVVLRLTVLERVPYLLLGAATLWLAIAHPAALLVVFFAALFLALFGSGLTSPPWLDMVARSVPSAWLGRFFGLWTGLGSVLGIGGGAIAALLLARVAWPLNFALCFLMTFATFIVSFVLLSLGREVARPQVTRAIVATSAPLAERVRVRVREVWQPLSEDAGLRRLVAGNALAGAATMAAALFAVAALRGGGLSDPQVGAEGTVLFLGSTAGYFAWGAIGDRWGHRAVLAWGALCGGVSALLALGARGFWAYALVFLILGLSVAATGLAGMTFITEFGPPVRRPTYIALASLAYAPFAVGAPLVGGWIANQWGYAPVFALSAAAGLAAAATYRFLVPEPRHASAPAIGRAAP